MTHLQISNCIICTCMLRDFKSGFTFPYCNIWQKYISMFNKQWMLVKENLAGATPLHRTISYGLLEHRSAHTFRSEGQNLEFGRYPKDRNSSRSKKQLTHLYQGNSQRSNGVLSITVIQNLQYDLERSVTLPFLCCNELYTKLFYYT